jgi:ketosteroid isomerase-like protein
MKNFKILFTLSVISLLIFPSCQTPQVDIQAEKDAILKLSGIWTEAIRNKNVEDMMSVMAPDAIFMLQDMPLFEGEEAIRESFVAWYADTTIDFSTFQAETLDLQVSSSGDMAYERGREQYTINAPEGMIEVRNKWIDIWKKIDGQWKAVVVIGNNDNP